MTFGETLKNLRKEKGLTIDALSKQIKTNRQSIIDYESNKSMPKIEILKEISLYFGVSLDYLIFGENRINICQVDPSNIKSALIAVGAMLNNGLLEIKSNFSSFEPIELIAKNNILKCYLLDYIEMQKRLDGYPNTEEKNKILLLLSEKY